MCPVTIDYRMSRKAAVMEEADPVRKFRSQRSKSQRLYERAQKVMPSGTTRNVVFYKPFPAYADHGIGSRIYFVDGNESIDYCFNQSSLILGHKHPKVMHAIARQLERGTALGTPTELEVELAEKIVKSYPAAEKVRFAGTGTEAMMNAVRVARGYKGKNKIAKFEGQFHGTHDSVYLSVSPPLDKAGPKSNPLAVPECEGMPNNLPNEAVILPFEDLEATEQIVRKSKDDLAVLIVEPLAKPRGYAPMKEGFLKALRDITEENDVLLMFDEVVTGFRLSEGGAAKVFQVGPDMVVFGKNIGGGFPVGAFGGTEETMQLFEIPEGHRPRVGASGTWNAHPLTVAAGFATLNELDSAAYERLESRGNELRDGMNKAFADAGVMGKVTGFSSLCNLYFTSKTITDYRSANQSSRYVRWIFDLEMLNRGAFFALNQGWFNVSTVTSAKDVRFTVEQTKEALNAIRPLIQEKVPELLASR
jgi:glutamate-1-semialdehyde 2,1-aminomutase